ncbi:hypothetical protein C0991_010546, partial [Blastosporella zonata]
ATYPHVADTIKAHLQFLCDGGAPITLVTARGVMIATILSVDPSLLKKEFRDGSTFQASDSFMRKWLQSAMGWSLRKSTRAARKLPQDWEDKCQKSIFRKAYIIKEFDIPIELFVNSDQTQAQYAPGDKMTWVSIGAKQVSIVGGEEKRAFTVLVLCCVQWRSPTPASHLCGQDFTLNTRS